MRGKYEGKRVIGLLLGRQAQGACACCLEGTLRVQAWGLYERWRANIDLTQFDNSNKRRYSDYLMGKKGVQRLEGAESLVGREKRRSLWSGGGTGALQKQSGTNVSKNNTREDQYQIPGAPLRKAEIRKNLILNRLLDSDQEVEELHPPWESAGSVSKLEQALELYRVDLKRGRHHVRCVFFILFVLVFIFGCNLLSFRKNELMCDVWWKRQK